MLHLIPFHQCQMHHTVVDPKKTQVKQEESRKKYKQMARSLQVSPPHTVRQSGVVTEKIYYYREFIVPLRENLKYFPNFSIKNGQCLQSIVSKFEDFTLSLYYLIV